MVIIHYYIVISFIVTIIHLLYHHLNIITMTNKLLKKIIFHSYLLVDPVEKNIFRHHITNNIVR